MQKRALIVIRLSNLTDETSSPQRQREVCEKVCTDRGYTVTGVAEDLDVSASTSGPFERPSLRKWLDRPADYDVIVFWRVDRLVRRVTHLSEMISWAENHQVALVSATEAHFDLSTSIGQAVAYMVGIFAQMEADAIRERTEQAHRYNRRQGKYVGGYPPFGYLPEQDELGEWRYVPDPVQRELLHSLIDRILTGERPTSIVRDLNDREVPTPEDYFRQYQGKPLKGSKWRTGNLSRALRSPTLLGQMTYRPVVGKKNGRKQYGEPVLIRGEDGSPLVRSEPLVSRDIYDRLQQALDDMNGKKSPYKTSQTLLLRVIFCGTCGAPMYRTKGRNRYHYRCASIVYQKSCGNSAPREEDADEFVTSHLLGYFGDLERKERVYDPGDDTATELAEVVAELEDVAATVGTGPYRSGPLRKRLDARAEALEARRQELENRTVRLAGYRYEPTGETFAQFWNRLTKHERNLFLRDNQVWVGWEKGDYRIHTNHLGLLLSAIDPNFDPAEYMSRRLG